MKKYKKIISTVLLLAMSFSFTACGGSQPKTEDIAGEYAPMLWFLDGITLTLNDNTTYKWQSGDYEYEKGTFELKGNELTLVEALNEDKDSYEVRDNSLIYTKNEYQDSAWRFEKDAEYGLEFSPNEDGMTDQTFTACILNSSLPGSQYNQLYLDLNDDGTYTIKLGIRGYSTLDYYETYEGTYSYEESALTLNFEGKDYPLYVDKNNVIYFLIYNKI